MLRVITRREAQIFLMNVQGLTMNRYEGVDGVLSYIKNAGCIQYDPVDVCGRNPEITLQARIPHYNEAMLYELLYESRELMDGYDKNMSIMPIDDWIHLSVIRTKMSPWVLRRQKETEHLFDEIITLSKERPFISSADFDRESVVARTWARGTKANQALDVLFTKGELVVHHKERVRRYYTHRSRYFDEEENKFASLQHQHAWFVYRRIGAVGMLWNRASDAFLGVPGLRTKERNEAYQQLLNEEKIVEIKIEGFKDSFYIRKCDEPLLGLPISEPDRVEFLAPLDPFMWDRKLIKALYDFDYKWEIYTPEKDRLYDAYVLPVINGGDFIGRISLARDKTQLVVKNIWRESGKKLSKRLLDKKLRQYAKFLNCKGVIYEC